MSQFSINVKGMSCAACANRVEPKFSKAYRAALASPSDQGPMKARSPPGGRVRGGTSHG